MKPAVTGGLAAFLLLVGVSATPALSQGAGDPDAGGDVFDAYCSDCHSVSPKGTNKKGPSLFRVVGRRAAMTQGFAYSASMRGSGIVWTTDKIAAYLANPKAVVPAGTMKVKGKGKPQGRGKGIAHLGHPD